MRAEQPQIAGLRDRQVRGPRRLLLARIGLGTEEGVELARLEAESTEIDAEVRQLACLQRQHLAVPAGPLGELVVGKDVGALLRLAEMAKLDHRH